MKRILLILIYLQFSIFVLAQSQNDYMDDSAVAGSVDRVFGGLVIVFLIVMVLFVLIFIIGGVAKIKYEFSPQKEIDRQKKEKEEREKQEKIRKEQERRNALLSLPENTIRLLVEGRPHIVELAGAGNRIHSEMLAICLWTVDKIVWDGVDITSQIGSIEKGLNWIYGKHYNSRYMSHSSMYELIVSKHCADLADKSSNATFEIEFTIRGDFDTQKLKIIHHVHEGLIHERISRDIKCLEFISYDGDIIQTHLVNGKSLCYDFEGYKSYKYVNDGLFGRSTG